MSATRPKHLRGEGVKTIFGNIQTSKENNALYGFQKNSDTIWNV